MVAAGLIAVFALVSGNDTTRRDRGFQIGRNHPGQGGGAGGSAGGGKQVQGPQPHPVWVDETPADLDRELHLLKGPGANGRRNDLSWARLETYGEGKVPNWYVTKADTFLQ